jgi:hypothetical protein
MISEGVIRVDGVIHYGRVLVLWTNDVNDLEADAAFDVACLHDVAGYVPP